MNSTVYRAALSVGPPPSASPWDAVKALFGTEVFEHGSRRVLLSASPATASRCRALRAFAVAFPRQQKGECIVGEYHEVHASRKGAIKRQHPGRRLLMAAVAKCIEARDRGA